MNRVTLARPVSRRWWTARAGRRFGDTVRGVARCILCGSRFTVAEVCGRPPCVGFGVVACDTCGAS